MCVICSCLLCPYLVCSLSLFHVIMSSCVSNCVYVIVLITLCIIVLSFELISSGQLVTPRCILSLCLVLSCLDVFIKDYYLSLSPRLRVLVPPSCVHRDRRPDLTVSGAPSPRFVFVFKSLLFCSYVLSVSRQGSRRSSSRSSPRMMRGSSAGPPRVPRVLWSRALSGTRRVA